MPRGCARQHDDAKGDGRQAVSGEAEQPGASVTPRPSAAPAPPGSWCGGLRPPRAFPSRFRPPPRQRWRRISDCSASGRRAGYRNSAFANSFCSRALSAVRSITPLSGKAATSPRTRSCTAPSGTVSHEHQLGHPRESLDEFEPAFGAALGVIRNVRPAPAASGSRAECSSRSAATAPTTPDRPPSRSPLRPPDRPARHARATW